MLKYPNHGSATSNVLAWSSHSANVESVAEDDAAADADEPPDSNMATTYQASPQFRRASVAKARENHASLLTQALQSASEGESPDSTPVAAATRRRRSITSQISLASTADLTSDTGLSTPARTNTPSPRLPSIGFAALPLDKQHGASGLQIIGSLPRRPAPAAPSNEQVPKPEDAPKDPAVEAIAKKRCISFACAKPKVDVAKPKPAVVVPVAAPAPAPAAQTVQPRKTCIKFACTARPTAQQTPPQKQRLDIPKPEEIGSVSTVVTRSPTTTRKARSPVASRSRPSPRRSAQSPVATRKTRFITADSRDLQGEICHFHEFASDHPTEEDWIRQEKGIAKARLTMDDLLKKENDIRRLGKEAEEEAEQEEAEEEEGDEALDEDDDDEENVDDEDDGLVEEEDMEEDDQSGYGSDDDFSDGYNTDEEYGFAESDDEENDGLHLWTFNAHQASQGRASEATPVFRPWSLGGHHSDSSIGSKKHIRGKHSQSRLTGRPVTPELPDSTDFVCGTMDEDRPLEEAYFTRLAARKQEKLRIIPQDIDPSFPTSEPEDEDEDDVKPGHGSDDHLWLHGELEELEEERADRRHRRGDNASPKRLRSPPPKRLRSPPPKARGRSPRRVFDRASPRRIKSPAPQGLRSPRATPTHAENVLAFKAMASRPGLTHTKSLPRGAYFPAHVKSGRRTRANTANRDNAHVRGAIDIVKGLEHKRQRRKEKFYQKYCNRARKGQIPEKKAQPGEGAERMRELGLTLAGKMGQGNYVISI
ncbi:hypothetical protein KVR01_004156 [Diaporthe batatas]|uniref:uncharacterized protein n=1 Tax=Diaporthe batatas TaxID=748121 RepID=UPI001D044ADA|nr:uncharacterized protein KVR01_004156 [Diaporthe batatas]KAG8165604.1 hypothetical protein KVR01_004156 [Diaporthe batatas]